MADLQPASASNNTNKTPQAAPRANITSINTTQEASDADLSIMSSTNTLDGLPPEMFERVAELTTFEGLKSLRLVSRSINAKAWKTCKAMLFSTVRVMLCSEASLRAAKRQARHPVFGDSIRQVILYDNMIANPNKSYESIISTRSFIQEWEKERGLQKAMKRRGEVLRLLAALLKTLHKGGRLSCLRIERWHRLARSSGPPLLPNQCYECQYRGDPFVLQTVLRAIIDSGLSAETFAMSFDDKHSDKSTTLLPVAKDGYDPAEMSQYEAAFSRFGNLELTLSVEYTGKLRTVDSGAIRSFCAATFCQKLVSLNIVGPPQWHSTSHGLPHQFNALMGMTFPCLRTLYLEGYDVECDALSAFVARHKRLSKATFGFGQLRNVAGTMDYEENWDFYQELAASSGIPEMMHDEKLMGLD
ncbi:hypothetical protein TI39_contig351g00007 [Zymoseptoria brevis]|uniref:F-box domain-containing protein n=1 Tax=Zymoseptoria brevis TaxID=1047168 RepID=A0A0F4GUB3_9PEZI|nr:hypothetical protein TI39_contig351g00007 [Zymoseptoria brevis]